MPFLGAIPMVIGTAISAAGSVASGIQQSRMAEYNAEAMRRNAQAAIASGRWEMAKTQEKGESLGATQRTAYAASGVDISEGSPLTVMADTAAKVERDILAEKYQSQVKAYGFESQANLMDYYGDSAFWSGLIGAGGTLLTGLGKNKPFTPAGSGTPRIY